MSQNCMLIASMATVLATRGPIAATQTVAGLLVELLTQEARSSPN